MIEAVIALPVMIALCAGALFLRDRYLARQHALLEARRCAWAHALSGCGTPPDGCAANAMDASGDDDDAVAIMSAARARGAAKIDVFDDVPVLGDAISRLFGTQTGASAERTVKLPGSGGAQIVERAEVVVLCNERPQDVLAAAHDVFCKNVELLHCGSGTR
jgi:hypothetical protein